MHKLLLLGAATVLSYLLNTVLIEFSRRLNIQSMAGFEKPSQIRWASGSKPLVGGISFYIILLLMGTVLAAIMPHQSVPLTDTYLPLLTLGSLGFSIGLADDAYTTRAFLKFLGQFGCGIIILLFGQGITLFHIPILDAAITIFWVVGIMNSINMLDNMDGITASTSLIIIAVALLAIPACLPGGDPLLSGMLVCTIGSLIGFLVLNWNPAKLYMGDNGSQFLGVVLAYLGIRFFWNAPDIAGIHEPFRQISLAILVFLMPILDTTFVTVARLRRGGSPFVGGKDHITHHLSYFGIPDKYIPLVTGAVSVCSGLLALYLQRNIQVWHVAHTLWVMGYILSVAGLLLVMYQVGVERKNRRTNPTEAVKLFVTSAIDQVSSSGTPSVVSGR